MHVSPTPLPASLPAPAADLIPHRRPVRLIEQLVAFHTQGATTRAKVREESPFVTPKGTLGHAAHRELMSQTYAAVKGWRDRQHGQPPRVGYLVGATGMECFGTARIGNKLTTTIQETATFNTFKIVQGQVYARDQRLAHGQLRLWLEPTRNESDILRKTPVKEAVCPPTPLRQAIKAAAANSFKWETDRSIVQSFCFPPEFIAFQGHFPGIPLLPAFAQVQIGHVMLEAAWQAALQLTRLDKAKFRKPLRPGQDQIPGTAAPRTNRHRPLPFGGSLKHTTRGGNIDRRRPSGMDVSHGGSNGRDSARVTRANHFLNDNSVLFGPAIILAIFRGA